jgi:hypothetical protein
MGELRLWFNIGCIVFPARMKFINVFKFTWPILNPERLGCNDDITTSYLILMSPCRGKRRLDLVARSSDLHTLLYVICMLFVRSWYV